MTLHQDLTIAELTDFCLLCKEYGDEVKQVRVDKPTLRRIRHVGCIVLAETKILGIRFFARNSNKTIF